MSIFTSHTRKRGLLLCLLVIFHIHCVSCLKAPDLKAAKQRLPKLEVAKEDEKPLLERIVTESTAAITVLYGTTLLLYGSRCTEQILVLSMMRSTGYSRFERAHATAKKNLRKAIRSAIWHAPSFLEAADTVSHLHDRMDEVKNIIKENRKAKQDGDMTPREERHLRHLQKRQLKLFRRDVRRMERASFNFWKFLKVLNVGEVLDIYRALISHVAFIIVAAHSKLKYAKTITWWCYFWGFGTLLYDVARRLVGPTLVQKRKSKANKIRLGVYGKMVIAGLTVYLMDHQRDFAYRLNSALMAAAIILHGLRYFLNALWDQDEDSTLGAIIKSLPGTGGGLIMVVLSALSLVCSRLSEQDKMPTPEFISTSTQSIESGILNFVDWL